MARPLIVVFAKAPVRGEVKTRLAAGIGEDAALDFYKSCLGAVLAQLGRGDWDMQIAVTPDEAIGDPFLTGFAASTVLQGDGDLGRRMDRFLSKGRPDRPVVIVGSDIPDVTVQHVEEAIFALRTHDLAIGPCPDGGYWLIGASRPPHASLFDNVRWSSASALNDTMRNASGLSVARLAELEDVDDEADYRRYVARHV